MAYILIADDEPKLGRVLVEMLEGQGHDVARVGGGRDALAAIQAAHADILITDLHMPDLDGLAVLRATKKASPSTDVILMTAYATAESAVEAMTEGAADYLIKPFAMDELRIRVRRLVEKREVSRRTEILAKAVDTREGFGRVIATSAMMKEVVSQAQRVARTDETVLLLGESGTGKSLFARAIHHASPRAVGPLVEVHAAALPESLVEGELFGHERGAYTGATGTKAGYAESAHGGTLFLDEIGELSGSTQTKLLRLIQDRTFMRLGSTETRKSDVRIIAVTNRDLQAEVKAGRFREDLYYRLAVFPIVIPPLRDRPDDIRAGTLAILASRSLGPDRITREAMAAVCAYSWPGNMRELENAITRAIVLAGTDVIDVGHLPDLGPRSYGSRIVDDLLVPGFSIDAIERELIQTAISKAGGNKAAAARLLGITRRRLYSKLDSIEHGKLAPDDD